MDLLSAEHLTALADRIWTLIVTFVPRLVAAALILIVAAFLARKAAQGLSKLMGRTTHVDPTIRFVASEFIRYAIIILALIASLEQLGIRTTSLFAVLGAAGLAIGLALQGTLSNIAAGLMLLWLRPFHIGDYIEVNNVPGLAGTVRQIGLFTCQLEAFDGLYLLVPNSGLWNVPLRNYTRNTGRLISMAVTIPVKADPEAARKALLDLAKANEHVAKAPEPIVFVERVNADSTLLNFRLWAAHEHIGVLQREAVEAVTKTLSAIVADAGPIQVIRIIPPDTDPTRLVESSAI